jgi:hypothetical protein
MAGEESERDTPTAPTRDTRTSSRGYSPAPPPYDYSGDTEARENRRVKAERIVAWCLENGWEPDLVDAKTRRWIVRQAIPPKVSANGKRTTYATASDETWALVVTDYCRERDRTWLQRELANDDSPAGRLLAAAAAKRAAGSAEDGQHPPAT